MKASKYQLLTIGNLHLSGKVEQMDDKQFDDYCRALDEFIEGFPAQESNLKAALEKKDCNAFSTCLLSLLDMLSKIHADGMVKDSFSLLSEVRGEKYDAAQVHLTEFLSGLSMLSIDIQMAQYRATEGEDTPEENKDEDEEESGNEASKSILAVDDVSFLLSMLKAALQDSEYRFTGVTSGAAALRYLGNHTPDLFILDIEMPDMNGYELAGKIRSMGHTAPIIFLTGNSTREYVLKAIQVGAADFIVKPVNKAHVLDKIRKFIG